MCEPEITMEEAPEAEVNRREAQALYDAKCRAMDEVSGKLLEKISRAIDELDIQVLRQVRKEKEVLYDHPQRADKATKEVSTETETITEVKTPVDRNGIKLLAAALRDVRDIRMVRDPLDIMEQEAKIAKLRRDAEEDRDSGTLVVTFAPETEEFSG